MRVAWEVSRAVRRERVEVWVARRVLWVVVRVVSCVVRRVFVVCAVVRSRRREVRMSEEGALESVFVLVVGAVPRIGGGGVYAVVVADFSFCDGEAEAAVVAVRC